ncbi:MAG TPA: GH116 family glycosyl hydrolase [Candidatus Hydrogenedentes bacterium]|nr:GH116 family glycosyl hydrolase [Candidatus Hydrogenedentota bacterium]
MTHRVIGFILVFTIIMGVGEISMNWCSAQEISKTKSTLFPRDLPKRDWVHFNALGFSKPVCGVIYRLNDTVTNGLALGGIDTGCIDLETSGMLGYCTIFNSHIPRRGPINLPILGLSTGGQIWVLCDPKQIKQGSGGCQVGPDAKTTPPEEPKLSLNGIKTATEIHYWGHYPVADLEFETDAPVSVALRAWAPFFPGVTADSVIPAILFEVHLGNITATQQKGTIAVSFPGPAESEAGAKEFTREDLKGEFTGSAITAKLVSYALGTLNEPQVRLGGGLNGDGKAWSNISKNLPPTPASDAGKSAAVDFDLAPAQEKVVRFLLTWCATTWNGVGINGAQKVYDGYSGEPRLFTHMYAKRFPDPITTAKFMAENHEILLKRVLAWQQVIYSENRLPVWLRDSLINVLYMMSEDSYWAQKLPPLPEWVREEDGLFGMNECPRGCPQIECIPCSFYGSLPIAYFFPELELATLRGYKGYQFEDGAPTWIFGGCTGRTPYIDFAYPTKGYQFTTNGISLASLVDQFLLCHDTPDKQFLKEFYPMIKKCMEWTVKLRTTPEYSIGERIISMPDKNEGTEWFEAPEPGWCGMTAHVGGLHLAQLRITERMAKEVGDTAFAEQCASWIQAAQEAMEKRLWDERGYYLNFMEPETGQKSEFVFGYQLDGEWIIDHHGLAPALPEDKSLKALDTIKRCNIAVTKYGAVNYANPDGSPAAVKGYGTYSYFPPEALMLAMTYMYRGQSEFGIELARKVWHNLFCLQGYTWDMPNIMRGDVDTGERTFGNDYYQDMMLWSLPAALEGKELSSPTKPGGLVNRVIAAAKGL